MRCATCTHSTTDHASGRCVHRNERLHRASGVTVVEACRCKRFVDAPVWSEAPVSEEPAKEEAEDAPRRFGRRRASQPVEPTT